MEMWGHIGRFIEALAHHGGMLMVMVGLALMLARLRVATGAFLGFLWRFRLGVRRDRRRRIAALDSVAV